MVDSSRTWLGQGVTYHQRNLKAAAELYLSWVFSIAIQPTVDMMTLGEWSNSQRSPRQLPGWVS